MKHLVKPKPPNSIVLSIKATAQTTLKTPTKTTNYQTHKTSIQVIPLTTTKKHKKVNQFYCFAMEKN